MSMKTCPHCNNLFELKDVVKAVIITTFVPLKSKITYALEKPTECLEVAHLNCNFPKGEPEGD